MSLRFVLAAASIVVLGSSAAGGCSGYDKPELTREELDAMGYDAECFLGGQPGQGDLCTRDCFEALCNSDLGRRVCTCEGGVYLQCLCQPPEGWPYSTSPTPTAQWCDRITGQPRYMQGDRCQTAGAQCISEVFPDQGCNCVADSLGRTNWICGAAATLMVPAEAPKCEDFGSGIRTLLNGKPCDTQWELCVARDYYLDSTTPRGCACLSRDGGLTTRWVCGSTNRWFRPE